jgi:acetyltransferase-like isoleucine patch superfamily enzyme
MQVLKEIVRYVALALGGLVALPGAVLSILEEHTLKTDLAFHFGANLVALVPGLPGDFIRAAYYVMTLKSFHPTATVNFGSYFSSREATMGAKAGMGAYCIIGEVSIGPRVRLASRVSIVSGLHEHGNTATYDHEQVHRPTRVIIGADAWIGEGAVVGADVGEKAIVAVGAIVVRPVPSGALAMGNPARCLPQTRKTTAKETEPGI